MDLKTVKPNCLTLGESLFTKKVEYIFNLGLKYLANRANLI